MLELSQLLARLKSLMLSQLMNQLFDLVGKAVYSMTASIIRQLVCPLSISPATA